ncbi:MAG: hypothetical protein ACE5I1_03890 [bacterium]
MAFPLTPQEKRLVIFKRLQMTQGEAAAKLGISRQYFNRCLHSPKTPRHFDLRLTALYRSLAKKQERNNDI